MSNDTTVRSVERALDILESLAQRGKGSSLSEISHSVKLPTTTTLRLLATLEARSFITKDSSTGLYCLGRKMAEIGDSVFSNLDICTVGYPYLEELHSRYNESVGFYIAAGKERICVARIDCTQALRQSVPVGSIRPIDCGASGHILVAYGDDEQMQEIRRNSSICTEAKLEQVRSQGYSVSYGEIISGLTSIAAPVFDSKSKLVCALVLAAPSIRVPPQVETAYIQIVKATAAQLSSKLGYCGL